MMPTSDRTRLLLPLLIGLIYSLTFGFNYGISNQNTYLIHAFHLAHPLLLANDWLVTRTTDFHFLFSHFASWIYRCDQTGWSFAGLNTLSIAYCIVGIAKILHRVDSEHRSIPNLLLLTVIMGVTHTSSVASHYLFINFFQPSTFGVLGFLWAIVYFLEQRFLVSGLCMALGGLFHIHFAILGLILFFLAHMLLGPERKLRAIAEQCAPSLVPLALYLPTILRTAFLPGTAEAQSIFIHVRVAHHIDPHFFYRELSIPLAWAVPALSLSWRNVFTSKLRPFFAFYFSLLVWLVVVSVVSMSPFSSRALSMLYPWRVAPFLDLMSQILVCTTLTRWCSNLARNPSRHVHSDLIPIVGRSIGIVLCLFGVTFSIANLKGRSTLLSGLPKDEAELFQWAQTTPTGTLFLVPPTLERFRLNAQRAIVVDWKSHPMTIPVEFMEWYGRLKTEMNVDTIDRDIDLDYEYSKNDDVRLQALRSTYRFDYAIFRKTVDRETGGEALARHVHDKMAIAFENPAYVVLNMSIQHGTATN